MGSGGGLAIEVGWVMCDVEGYQVMIRIIDPHRDLGYRWKDKDKNTSTTVCWTTSKKQ
jgi:hypothetical protein